MFISVKTLQGRKIGINSISEGPLLVAGMKSLYYWDDNDDNVHVDDGDDVEWLD